MYIYHRIFRTKAEKYSLKASVINNSSDNHNVGQTILDSLVNDMDEKSQQMSKLKILIIFSNSFFCKNFKHIKFDPN